MEKQPCVYILASKRHGALYVGVRSDLLARLHQHRVGAIEGFTSRYAVHRLAWFEQHETLEMAFQREKRIKKWNRDWKLNLIEQANPEWVDLAIGLGFEPLTSAQMDSRLRGNHGVVS